MVQEGHADESAPTASEQRQGLQEQQELQEQQKLRSEIPGNGKQGLISNGSPSKGEYAVADAVAEDFSDAHSDVITAVALVAGW